MISMFYWDRRFIDIYKYTYIDEKQMIILLSINTSKQSANFVFHIRY